MRDQGNRWLWLQRRPWVAAGFGLASGFVLLGLLDLATGVGEQDRAVPLTMVVAGLLILAWLLSVIRK